MSIEEYIEWYVLYIPAAVYGWGLVVFLMALLLMTVWKGWKGVRYALWLLLVEYTALLLHFTVFIRNTTGKHEMILMPLWSYVAIHGGMKVLMQEVLSNVVVFIPIGFLLGIVLRKSGLAGVMAVGIGISVVIELLQFTMMRGFCETDDVIHNAVGCLIGWGLGKSLPLSPPKREGGFDKG